MQIADIQGMIPEPMRIGVAALAGAAVAAVYRGSVVRDAEESKRFRITLILLTTLVATTTLVIAESLARAFGLVGALAIVRFRTVVADTRDTAFVIFAVAMGMAIGAGNYTVSLICFAVVAAVMKLTRGAAAGRPAGGASTAATPARVHRLLLRIGAGGGDESSLRQRLLATARTLELQSVTTARQGTAIDLEYGIELPDEQDLVEFVRMLNGIEGVQHVELGRD